MADTTVEAVTAATADADAEAELAALESQLYGNASADGDAASEDPATEGQAAGPAQPMSKSQMKKLAKLERLKAKREEAKARDKEERAARRKEVEARKAAEFAAMTPEERAARREESKAKLQAHKDKERALREKMQKSLEAGPRVVIDLDFEDKMRENDIRHLAQQLGFAYSANKNAERPVHMLLTSFKGGVAATVRKMVSGVENWHVTRTEASYLEHFAAPEERSRLVYLTADAEDELTELDEQKIYIIGGIVDHNQYKGLCEEQAQAQGIATARLPIAAHVQLASRAVLTVNHVFQILVEYYNNPDWAAVLDSVLPKRKRADYLESREEGGGGGGWKGANGGGRGGQQQQGKGQAAAAGAANGGQAGDKAPAPAAQEEEAAEAVAGSEGGVEAAAAAEGAATGGEGEGEGEGPRGTKRKAEEDAPAAE